MRSNYGISCIFHWWRQLLKVVRSIWDSTQEIRHEKDSSQQSCGKNTTYKRSSYLEKKIKRTEMKMLTYITRFGLLRCQAYILKERSNGLTRLFIECLSTYSEKIQLYSLSITSSEALSLWRQGVFIVFLSNYLPSW